MDFLEEKIFKEFQKENWELKTLREITLNMHSGDSKITQTRPISGNTPAITGGDVVDSDTFINECKVFVDEKIIKKQKYIKTGNLIIINADFCKENVGKACVYLGKEDCLTGNNISVLEHKQNPKYLSYIWSSSFVQSQIQSRSKVGIRTFLTDKILKI